MRLKRIRLGLVDLADQLRALCKDAGVNFGKVQDYPMSEERTYIEPIKAEMVKYQEDQGYRNRLAALSTLGDVFMSDFDCYADRTSIESNQEQLKEIAACVARSQYQLRRAAAMLEKTETDF
jgi:hypothetical protein